MPSDVGAVCECCEASQKKKEQPVRHLVALPAVRQGPALAVCEWCDEPVIRTAEATVARHAT